MVGIVAANRKATVPTLPREDVGTRKKPEIRPLNHHRFAAWTADPVAHQHAHPEKHEPDSTQEQRMDSKSVQPPQQDHWRDDPRSPELRPPESKRPPRGVVGLALVHRCWHPIPMPAGNRCSVRGCYRRPQTKGMCSRHYRAALKLTKPACSIPGCGRRSWAAGVCRWHRVNGGRPIKPMRPRSPTGRAFAWGHLWLTPAAIRAVEREAKRVELGPTAVMSEVIRGVGGRRCTSAAAGRSGRPGDTWALEIDPSPSSSC